MSTVERAAGKSWANQVCQSSISRLQEPGGIDEVVEYLSRDSSAKTADFKAGVQELIDSLNGAKK